MRDHASERQGSYARITEPAPAERAPPLRTPAEQARERLTMLVRETGDLHAAVREVRDARDANDLERWTHARTGVERRFALAERSLERVRAAMTATPEIAEEVARAEHELEQLRTELAALADAPRGFPSLAADAELLATFEAPLEGGFRVGFENKEAALKARFDRLSQADRKVLAERLRRPRPNDPIATAFGRFTEARRHSLLEHLASSRQRDAQTQNVPRERSQPRHPPSPLDGLGVRRAIPGHVDEVSVHAVEPEPLDAKLRRILETHGSNTAIENAFADVAAGLDGTTRRALAKRLETYRPGSGDEIAARFARLDRPLRQQICVELRTDVGPDRLPREVLPDLEAATGRSLAHVNLHTDARASAMAEAHEREHAN